MLVLSRKVGERIVIGPNVFVTVIEVRGDRVKLGFVAPDEVPIHREEVHRRLVSEALATSQHFEPEESPYYAEFA
jgi:carbon storage regulator